MEKVKILIVDDEQVVLKSCRKILEAEGYEVFLSSSAVGALVAVEICDCFPRFSSQVAISSASACAWVMRGL